MRNRALSELSVHWPRLRPWLALLSVALLFTLPDAVRDAGFKWQRMRISGDLLALLTLTGVSLHLPHWARWARRAFLAYGILLFLFRVDRMILGFLMQEEPLLYDQLFMARHLVVLVGDLWSRSTALITLAFVVGIAAVSFAIARLLRATRPLAEVRVDSREFRALYVLWLLALCASASDALALTRRPLVEWLSPTFVDNVDESVRTYRSVGSGLAASPYGPYEQVKLTSKPNVDIYVVESYGRMLWSHGGMRAQHLALLEGLEQRLQEAGWSAVSAFSASTVRGAGSWLADGTLITGAPVRYEAIFRHALSELARRPTLVSFFNHQGYDTVFVGPADRRRPGVQLTNDFGYTRSVGFAELGYKGPRIGWGVVPDQYSVSWVEENVVRKAQKPRFMNFHLVSSHAPWTQVPTRVGDWHEVNNQEGRPLVDPAQSTKQTLSRLRRYRHPVEGDAGFRPLKARYVNGYVATVAYDLELLTDLLVADTSSDRLVVLIGDHQPPLVAATDTGYDAPVHILSRREDVLAEFRERGFKPGLRLPSNASAIMGHGGMFSLLVRALTRCCSETRPLPPFLPRGQELLKVKPPAR